MQIGLLTGAAADSSSGSGSCVGRDAEGGRGGGGGGAGISCCSSCTLEAIAADPAPTLTPATTAAALDVAFGGFHFVPVEAGALNEAALLRDSSSTCCCFASACRSLQVSFLGPPAEDLAGGEDEVVDCWANFSNGLTIFFGAER